MISVRPSLGLPRIATAVVAAVLSLAPSSLAAQQPPAAEEQLGFSRYLPDDVDTYLSVMQLGRVVRTVGDSNAWKQVEQVPEVGEALAKLRQARESPDLPPEAKVALSLLEAAGESEVTIAARPDVSKNLLAVAKVALLSLGSFAPSRHQPDSPAGLALAKRQAEFRQEWVKTVASIQIPSLVVAARIREPATYDFFVQTAVDRGHRAALEALERSSPEVRAVIERSLAPVEIGKAKFRRFHLRLGDILPTDRFAERLQRSPFSPSEREAIVSAVSELSLVVHLGFVGDYLTLCISSNDGFIKEIVERHEGRSQETLAAGAAFAPIRAEVTPNTIGILYADSTATQNELKGSLLPLLRSLTAPEFLTQVGAPGEFGAQAAYFFNQIESAVAGTAQKQFSVLEFDQGLKQVSRMEFDRDPVAGSPKPPAVLGAVPASSLGVFAYSNGSLEPIAGQVRQLILQMQAQFDRFVKRFGDDDPQFASMFKSRRAALDDMLRSIDTKLSPSLKGEMAVVLGPFTQFEVGEPVGDEIPKLSIPSAALIIRSPSPDLAIEGITELYRTAAKMSEEERAGGGLPVSFDALEVDGAAHHLFSLRGPSVRGIEPHVVKVGEWLVISTSLDLSKQIREAAAGRAPAIASNPAFQAASKDLPATYDEVGFIDGESLFRNLGKTSDDVFRYFEANSEKLRMSARDLEQLAVAKRLVGAGLKFASTFRRAYGAVVYNGRTNEQRDWIRIQDQTPRSIEN